MRSARQRMQMVFQDPYVVEPRSSIHEIIRAVGGARPSRTARRAWIDSSRWSASIRRTPAATRTKFSGGQRQRIGLPGAGSRPEVLCSTAGLGARRQYPGLDSQPADGSTRRARRQLTSLHRPRSLGGAPHRRSPGGHAWTHCRKVTARRSTTPAHPYEGPVVGSSDS